MSPLSIYENYTIQNILYANCKLTKLLPTLLQTTKLCTDHRIKNYIRKYGERNLRNHVTNSTNSNAANRLWCPLV